MPVDALSSLIRTCSAANASQADRLQGPVQKCAPIASLGFWACSDVPLSAGTGSLQQKVSSEKQSAPDSLAVALPSLPLHEELKVRERLAAAKELAEVGDNIRWDLIIEQAARMPCGLKADLQARGLKKAPLSEDDDRRSTSASGSGAGEGDTDETEPELEASSSDEIENLGKDSAPHVLDAKMPPWRRSRVSTPGTLSSSQSQVATAPPPWRRNVAKETAHVYSVSTMLKYWILMNQSSIVETNAPEVDCSEAKELESVPPPPDAPWRRRPTADSVAISAGNDR